MSELTKFVSKGYSLGSFIPEEHYENLKIYHPESNLDPKKYLINTEEKNGKIEFYFNSATSRQWPSGLKALLKATDFILDPKNKNKLKAINPTGTLDTFNDYILKNIEIEVMFKNSNIATFFKEKLSWNAPNGDKFNTYWFWIPPF